MVAFLLCKARCGGQFGLAPLMLAAKRRLVLGIGDKAILPSGFFMATPKLPSTRTVTKPYAGRQAQ